MEKITDIRGLLEHEIQDLYSAESQIIEALPLMEGLVKEGQETIKMNASEEVRDAALIAAAQRVEHYEIAGYGTAHHYAHMLGEEEVAELLAETLDEEKDTDELLNDLAIEKINKEAQRSRKGAH